MSLINNFKWCVSTYYDLNNPKCFHLNESKMNESKMKDLCTMFEKFQEVWNESKGSPKTLKHMIESGFILHSFLTIIHGTLAIFPGICRNKEYQKQYLHTMARLNIGNNIFNHHLYAKYNNEIIGMSSGVVLCISLPLDMAKLISSYLFIKPSNLVETYLFMFSEEQLLD